MRRILSVPLRDSLTICIPNSFPTSDSFDAVRFMLSVLFGRFWRQVKRFPRCLDLNNFHYRHELWFGVRLCGGFEATRSQPGRCRRTPKHPQPTCHRSEIHHQQAGQFVSRKKGSKNSHLITFQILLFLDSCGGVEQGAKVAKIYYGIKKNSPEHFSNRDPSSPKIQQCLKNQDYFYLPNTPQGDLVVFHRLSSSRASDYCFDEAIKTFFMTIGKRIQLRNGRFVTLIIH